LTSVVHSFKNQLYLKPLFSFTNFKTLPFFTTRKPKPIFKMRFSVLAATFFAGAAVAEYVTSTEEITVTSCAASVTDCPARSTVVSTNTWVSSVSSVATVYPTVTPSSVPVVYTNSSSSVVYSAPPAPTTAAVIPTTTPAGVVVSSTPVGELSTITISTCVPTVIYSTITVVPTTTPAAVSVSPPVSTGVISVPGNVTSPSATATPSAYLSGASNVQSSVMVAAFAGLAAFIFA